MTQSSSKPSSNTPRSKDGWDPKAIEAALRKAAAAARLKAAR